MMTPAKLIRKIRNREAFTLVEVIIATSIFTVVSVIGVTVLVSVLRIQRRITLENAIFEDGRFLMERISREIRQNTIDYEEFYNRSYIAGGDESTYGKYFGCYGERFINPGSEGLLGYTCTLGSLPDCTVVNKTTLDINTGENPFAGNIGADLSDSANAVCDEDNHSSLNCATTGSSFLQGELYLINAAGNQKTVLAKKDVGGENAVAMVRLNGVDSDTDGIVEDWIDPATDEYRCADGYDCAGLDAVDGSVTKLEDTLTGSGELYEGFVPLTPLRTTVTSLRFYISPLEDPRKGFAETVGVQQQPHVTVVMSLQPAASELSEYADDPPTITMQTTITSRVYNEVKSFLGRPICP